MGVGGGQGWMVGGRLLGSGTLNFLGIVGSTPLYQLLFVPILQLCFVLVLPPFFLRPPSPSLSPSSLLPLIPLALSVPLSPSHVFQYNSCSFYVCIEEVRKLGGGGRMGMCVGCFFTG